MAPRRALAPARAPAPRAVSESAGSGLRAVDERLSFVFITGLSGAGKSYAIKCFEDMGFFCVDNLPTTLIPTFADLIARSAQTIRRVALEVDVREGEPLPHCLDAIRRRKPRGR